MMVLLVGAALAATTPVVGVGLATTADRDTLTSGPGQVTAEDRQVHTVGRLELGAAHDLAAPWTLHGHVGLPVVGSSAVGTFSVGGERRWTTRPVWGALGLESQLVHRPATPWRQAWVPAATVAVGWGAWSLVARVGWAEPLRVLHSPAGPTSSRTQSAAPGLRPVDVALRWRPGHQDPR